MKTVIYDRATGAIEMTVKGSENDCLNTLRKLGISQFSYIEGSADPEVHYVDVATDELRDRAPFDLHVSGNTVANVPEGAAILFPATRERLTMDQSGTLELVVAYPETVAIRLTHPHYLNTEIEVPCT